MSTKEKQALPEGEGVSTESKRTKGARLSKTETEIISCTDRGCDYYFSYCGAFGIRKLVAAQRLQEAGRITLHLDNPENDRGVRRYIARAALSKAQQS